MHSPPEKQNGEDTQLFHDSGINNSTLTTIEYQSESLENQTTTIPTMTQDHESTNESQALFQTQIDSFQNMSCDELFSEFDSNHILSYQPHISRKCESIC